MSSGELGPYAVGSIIVSRGIISEQRDLLALYLSGTYCDRTGTRPPSCVTLQ